jgi:hypothetical protein
MPDNNSEYYTQRELRKGYQPKGYIVKVIQGKQVKIPVSELKINPPKAGTAVITPERK